MAGKAPSAAQTIAQAKKNLADTSPKAAKVEAKPHPALTDGRPKPREQARNGGLVEQYKKMSGSAMW